MTQTAKRFASLVRFLMRILDPELSLWTWQRDIMPTAVSCRRGEGGGRRTHAEQSNGQTSAVEPAQTIRNLTI